MITATAQNRRPASEHALHARLLAAVIAIAIAVLTAPPNLPAAEPAPAKLHWLRDIGAALKLAASTDRDVLINFTGHGWCFSCELLDREVFAKPEFAPAAEDFVLVELDFPQGEPATDAEAASLKKYRQWQSKYLTPGVPTVVLVDSAGLPFAYTGYEAGITPASFLKQIDQFRAAHTHRDRAMRQATRKTGTERAASLDAALEAVAPHLGTLAERGGDPLLNWYGDTVQEICRLDSSDKLGLRTKYTRRQDDVRLFVESERFFTKLKELKSNQEALAYIESVLPTVSDAKIVWRLERARQTYLEWENLNELALENARRLLTHSDLTRDQQEDLKFRVAFNLKNLARYSEAVAQLDELIVANEDRPGRQLDHMNFKAFCLKYAADDGGDAQAAIAAFQQLRARCKPDSDDWQVATRHLGIQFQKLGRFEEALALRLEMVERQPAPATLLEATETYISLGRTADAEKNLAEAQRLIELLPSDRQDEAKAVQWLTDRAEDLRRQLNRPSE